MKWNIYGQEKYTDVSGRSETWDIFNGNKMFDDDYNRFQLGYQAGLKLVIANSISIGAAWKADITPFCSYYDEGTRQEEKERFRGLAFTLGYVF